MRPYVPRHHGRKTSAKLTPLGKLVLCGIVSVFTLAAIWSWSMRVASSRMEAAHRRTQLGMPVASPACPECAACPDCPKARATDCPACAHSTPPPPKQLPPWPGLLRPTQALELELWLDANPDVGSCFQGKNLLSSSDHAHCLPLNCLYSELAGFKVDVSSDLLSRLSDEAYPAECPTPRGGQRPVPPAPRGANGTAAVPPVQVSFIVTVHNAIPTAVRCIVELFRTAQEARSAEWVIVDDGSSEDAGLLDSAVERLRLLFGVRVTLIRNQEAEGYGAANMRAIRAATGEYLAIINSDLLVQPGWLWSLLRTFQDRPKVGLVGPLFLGEGQLITEAGGAVWSDASAGNYGRGFNTSHEYLFARTVDYVSAACNLVPRELFLEVGGFDPVYGKGFYEDTDVCMAIAQKGYLVLFQPLSVVYHQEGTTLGTDASLLKKSLMGINRNIFRRKWKKVLEKQHCPPGTPLSLPALRKQHPHILWIDDLVPEPDHDSGSIRTMQMLRILIQLGYGVTFQATGDLEAPEADRKRPERYIAQARFMGAEVLPALRSKMKPWDWLDWSGGRWTVGCPYDGVVVARRYIYEQWNATVAEMCPGVTIVYDTVDLHFLREARDQITKEEPQEGKVDFKQLQHQEVIRVIDALHPRHPIRIKLAEDMGYIDHSAVTMVVSDEELLMLEHYRPQAKTYLVGNIHELEDLNTSCDGRSGILFVGNFQHGPNQRAVRFLIREVLPKVLAALPPAEAVGFVAHIVGANFVPEDLRDLMARTPHVVFHGYVPEETLRMLHFRVKAVVAPLVSGAGVKGKVNTALKWGVPAVVTPVAAEGMYLVDRDNALIAADAITFAKSIVEVSSDCKLWKKVAVAGQKTMRSHFSISVAEEQLSLAMDAAGLHASGPGRAKCVVPPSPPPLQFVPDPIIL